MQKFNPQWGASKAGTTPFDFKSKPASAEEKSSTSPQPSNVSRSSDVAGAPNKKRPPNVDTRVGPRSANPSRKPLPAGSPLIHVTSAPAHASQLQPSSAAVSSVSQEDVELLKSRIGTLETENAALLRQLNDTEVDSIKLACDLGAAKQELSANNHVKDLYIHSNQQLAVKSKEVKSLTDQLAEKTAQVDASHRTLGEKEAALADLQKAHDTVVESRATSSRDSLAIIQEKDKDIYKQGLFMKTMNADREVIYQDLLKVRGELEGLKRLNKMLVDQLPKPSKSKSGKASSVATEKAS